jgi:hypothetical protein
MAYRRMGGVGVVAVRPFVPIVMVPAWPTGVWVTWRLLQLGPLYHREEGIVETSRNSRSNVTGKAHRRTGFVEVVAVRPFVQP